MRNKSDERVKKLKQLSIIADNNLAISKPELKKKSQLTIDNIGYGRDSNRAKF